MNVTLVRQRFPGKRKWERWHVGFTATAAAGIWPTLCDRTVYLCTSAEVQVRRADEKAAARLHERGQLCDACWQMLQVNIERQSGDTPASVARKCIRARKVMEMAMKVFGEGAEGSIT